MSDSKCNVPNLTVGSKLICFQMCCVSCTNNSCPAKSSCSKSITDVFKMLAFSKGIEELKEDNELIYSDMLKKTKLNNNVPDFLLV